MIDNKWILTKDHKPSRQECEDKLVVFHRPTWEDDEEEATYDVDDIAEYIGVFECPNPADRYVLIDVPKYVPEPVPCRMCGDIPTVSSAGVVACYSHRGHITAFGDNESEAIALWNKYNS